MLHKGIEIAHYVRIYGIRLWSILLVINWFVFLHEFYFQAHTCKKSTPTIVVCRVYRLCDIHVSLRDTDPSISPDKERTGVTKWGERKEKNKKETQPRWPNQSCYCVIKEKLQARI